MIIANHRCIYRWTIVLQFALIECASIIIITYCLHLPYNYVLRDDTFHNIKINTTTADVHLQARVYRSKTVNAIEYNIISIYVFKNDLSDGIQYTYKYIKTYTIIYTTTLGDKRKYI